MHIKRNSTTADQIEVSHHSFSFFICCGSRYVLQFCFFLSLKYFVLCCFFSWQMAQQQQFVVFSATKCNFFFFLRLYFWECFMTQMVQRSLFERSNCCFNLFSLAALEQKDGHLTQIEVNKVPGFMSDIGPEITSDDTMPSWVVFFVEFLKK